MTNTSLADDAPVRGNLCQALAAQHRDLEGWDGVADSQFLAEALSQIMDRYAQSVFGNAPNVGQNFIATLLNGPADLAGERIQACKDLALLDAMIGALQGQTVDGCRLKLTGNNGIKPTSAKFDKDLELAAAFLTTFEASEDYHSAAQQIADDNHCSKTTVTNADTKHRWLVEYLRQINDRSPDASARVRADLRANPQK